MLFPQLKSRHGNLFHLYSKSKTKHLERGVGKHQPPVVLKTGGWFSLTSIILVQIRYNFKL